MSAAPAGAERAAAGRVDLRWLGAAAIAGYAVHAGGHVLAGRWEDALWACHLGALLVGMGLLAGRPLPNAVGFLWLCVGDVLWGLDLASGGELIPTSLLTHVVGLVLGGVGVARMGMPLTASPTALVGFLALQLLSRYATPPTTNLNLAHAVWPGWESTFPSYWPYQAMLLSIGFAGFVLVQWLARRLLARRAG